MNEQPEKDPRFVKSGRKGGKRLFRKRGSAYFAKLAGKRKNFRGGRPKKVKEQA